VAGLAVRAAPLLHVRLEHVARALLQLRTHALFMVTEQRPVVVVELLDDLEGPTSVQDVAAHDFVLESVGHCAMPGLTQLVARFAKQKIGMAHQLMERIQMAAGALHEFERLRYRADGLDRRVVQAGRAPGILGLCHGETDTRYGESDTVPDKICIVCALNSDICPDRSSILAGLTTSSKHENVTADEPLYTVRVVAERLGVPTATLRSWNQRYGVGPSEHSPGRHRLYSETDIAVARRMYELIVEGASPRSAARTAIDSVRPARGDSAALLDSAFDFDVFTAGLLLDRHLRHFGVLDTWDQLIRPAFDDIAQRQAQGEGCIDVEHALSWTVTRSLQRYPIAAPEESASIILACTPRETHFLALEALRAALAEHGRGALMLGADVPRAALLDAVQRKGRPVTALLWSQTEDTADFQTVNDLAEHASVSVGGPGWDAVIDRIHASRLNSLGEAVDHFAAAN